MKDRAGQCWMLMGAFDSSDDVDTVLILGSRRSVEHEHNRVPGYTHRVLCNNESDGVEVSVVWEAADEPWEKLYVRVD